MISGRGFSEAVTITNPGGAPEAGRADLWRNDQVETDANGTVLSDWIGLFPPGTAIEPFAEVVQTDGGRVFWVFGETEERKSLLRGTPDHIEARLKAAFRFTTTATALFRDSDANDTNDLGDEVTTEVTVATGFPVSITEVSLSVPTASDERTRHDLVGWVDADLDAQRGDRLVADGVTYSVEKVTPPDLSTGLREKRLELARTT